MNYPSFKIITEAIEDRVSSKLSLGFKRFFSMLLMIGCLISGTLQQSLYEDYVPLLPGQHFYARAMMGAIYNSARLSYGGWFKGISVALKLKDMAIDTPVGLENMSLPTRMQYRYSPGADLSISTNTWVFVMWNTFCSGTNESLSSLNGTVTSFCPVNLEGAVSSHYHSYPAGASNKDIAPIYFGDPLINGTSWFDVEINTLQQSGLFYATTSNLSALYERTPQYMLGPYRGVKRGHKGFKFNIGITNMKMYQAAGDNPISMYSTESLQKLLVDPFGTYIPAGKYIEYEDFFDPAINQWNLEPDYARSLFIQWRMRRNTAGSTAGDEIDSWNCNQTMHFQLRRTPGETTQQSLTINFTIQRSTSKAWCRVKAIGAGVYPHDFEYEVSEVFKAEVSGAGVLYSMKIGMVLVQNDTETYMPSPIFNLIIEFASREAGSDLIQKVIKIWPRVDIPINPFEKFTARIVHTHTSATTNILSLYLDTLNEVRGGFMLNAMGFQGNSSTSDYCIGQTAVLSGSSTRFYCQICSGGILDVASGLCTSESSITGKNTTCDHWVSKDMCHSCSKAGFVISQVQRICTPIGDPCNSSGFSSSYVFDFRNMFGNSCNDVKYYDGTTGCTQYSNPVPGASPCVCDVSNCEKCLHTQCDECKFQYLLFIEGDSVTCRPTGTAVAGYGIDYYDVKLRLRPCMLANCQNCSADYKYCSSCVPPYKMDSIAKTCVLCETMNGRYFDTLTQICHSCHSSCTFCTGPLSTNCLACPTSGTWLRRADNLCRDCRPAANDKYTAPNGTVFGVILVNNICELCNYPCATCYDTTYCVICRPGLYYYSDYTCGSCTEPGRYISGGTDCKTCNSSCATCNGPTSLSCTSCDITSSLYLFADGSCKACTVSNGYYISNGSCLQCHTSCLTCINGTDTDCLSCGSSLFLNVDSDSKCEACNQPGFYKDLGPIAKCRKCNPTCQECTSNLSTSCTSCPSSYSLASDNSCKVCNISGPFYVSAEKCLDCHASCATCGNSSNSSCTSCYPSSFLGDDNTCTTCTVPGYYKDSSNPALPRCKKCDASCMECNGALSTNCLACPTGKYLSAKHDCTDCNATRMFVRQDNSLCDYCDRSCVNCSKTSTNCTECDTANGYILVNGSCVIQEVTKYIQCKSISVTSADIALSFLITPSELLTPSLAQSMWKSLNILAVWNSNVSGNILLYPSDSALRVDVKGMFFPGSFPKTVTLDVSWPVTKITEESLKIEKGTCFGQYERGPSQEQIKSAENQAAVVSGLTSTMSSTDSAVGMSLMGTLLAADPTGTFFRFTKILQIVNKLYFININYGKRLEAFLAKTSIVGKTPLPIENIKNHRGKLDQHKVTLDFVAAMSDKVVLYLISWILKGVKRLLLDNCIMGKIGIYFCHYANRAHLIIFNLVFIDFIWLAPRTLMHARGLSDFKICLAILVMCLIAADLCLILSHLLDDRIWRKALEHYTSLKEFCPIPETSSKANTDKSALQSLNEPGSAPKQDDPNQDQTKQINYKKTYFEIDFNVHLMDMATNTLRVDESVFQSILCRILMLSIWWRVILLQLTILSCQYANTLGLTVLLIIELSRLFATIYAYLKYKYLKNIICLLMEVLNCFSVGLFFLNALLISPKRFDELIMDFYQDAGIWIVIASCVAEYLLLLTYIGVATYDFFKNRKMMKRMNVKYKGYSLLSIKYAKKLESPSSNVSETLMDQTKDSVNLTLANISKAKPKVKSRLKAQGRLFKGLRSSNNGVEPVFKSIQFKPL